MDRCIGLGSVDGYRLEGDEFLLRSAGLLHFLNSREDGGVAPKASSRKKFCTRKRTIDENVLVAEGELAAVSERF